MDLVVEGNELDSVGSRSAVDISLIIPLYNEAQNLEPIYREASSILKSSKYTYEMIFIDDGSIDGSADILNDISRSDPAVIALYFRRNFGKGTALSSGFKESRGKVIVTLDADLQDNPADIPMLVKGIESGYDLVSGWKFPRRDPLSKTVPSKIFNKVVGMATGLKLHDFNCGIKAYSRALINGVRIYGEQYRYIPVLAHSAGFRVTEIKVDHRPRINGKSKYGSERYMRGFMDFLTVLFITRYTKKPLHLFGPIGLALLLIGFIINAHLAVLWLGGHAIGHRPMLTLGILLMVIGGQFVSTGLICEMIVRSQQHEDDHYVARTPYRVVQEDSE